MYTLILLLLSTTVLHSKEIHKCVQDCFEQKKVEKQSEKLLLIGGRPYDGVEPLIYFTPANTTSHHLDILEKELTKVSHVSGVFYNGIVVTTGGKYAVYSSQTTVFFDPTNNKVYHGPPISTTRNNAGGAVLGKAFYVCGGREEYTTKLQSCERLRMDVCLEPLEYGSGCQESQMSYYYDSIDRQCKSFGNTGCSTSKNNFVSFEECQNVCIYKTEMVPAGKWDPVKSMSTPRSKFQMIALDGYLYAIGGEGDECQCSVEKYSPRNNSWTMVAPLQYGRKSFGAAVLNGKIHICGGLDHKNETFVLNSCEIYDPVKDQWTVATPMKEKRNGFAMTTFNGIIYAAGHDSGESLWRYPPFWRHADFNIEKYNPINDEWNLISNYTIWPQLSQFTMVPV